MGYFKNLLTGISQFGGAICGINCDCSISATTGYYSHVVKPSVFWKCMRWMIDSTFYPVDGKGHCLLAVNKDPDENYKEGFKIPLFILTLVFCVLLSLIFWPVYLIGRIFNKFGMITKFKGNTLH